MCAAVMWPHARAIFMGLTSMDRQTAAFATGSGGAFQTSASLPRRSTWLTATATAQSLWRPTMMASSIACRAGGASRPSTRVIVASSARAGSLGCGIATVTASQSTTATVTSSPSRTRSRAMPSTHGAKWKPCSLILRQRLSAVACSGSSGARPVDSCTSCSLPAGKVAAHTRLCPSTKDFAPTSCVLRKALSNGKMLPKPCVPRTCADGASRATEVDTAKVEFDVEIIIPRPNLSANRRGPLDWYSKGVTIGLSH
mmetsp:Transcript_32059/g.96507  ORF Transcript_32059/g.96507 Transcript_32059/m.96507 type:complete len:256 (-) Transcript_32059:80-847(-)